MCSFCWAVSDIGVSSGSPYLWVVITMKYPSFSAVEPHYSPYSHWLSLNFLILYSHSNGFCDVSWILRFLLVISYYHFQFLLCQKACRASWFCDFNSCSMCRYFGFESPPLMNPSAEKVDFLLMQLHGVLVAYMICKVRTTSIFLCQSKGCLP